MLKCSEQDGAIHFTVRVVPKASRSQVVGEHDGHLRVRVAAQPVEGAANEELIRTLARALNVPRRAVEILSGHASKVKHVRVHGAMKGRLESLARES
jgi:uncharacterized protein